MFIEGSSDVECRVVRINPEDVQFVSSFVYTVVVVVSTRAVAATNDASVLVELRSVAGFYPEFHIDKFFHGKLSNSNILHDI